MAVDHESRLCAHEVMHFMLVNMGSAKRQQPDTHSVWQNMFSRRNVTKFPKMFIIYTISLVIPVQTAEVEREHPPRKGAVVHSGIAKLYSIITYMHESEIKHPDLDDDEVLIDNGAVEVEGGGFFPPEETLRI
eukprot:73248-Chlamydomonas_euryale.AAC.2